MYTKAIKAIRNAHAVGSTWAGDAQRLGKGFPDLRGSNGFRLGYKHSEATKKKISEAALKRHASAGK